MRPLAFRSDALHTPLLHHSIATLDKLKQAPDTSVDVTIFMVLCSRIVVARRGLVSPYGTLLATAEELVHRPPRGHFADELAPRLPAKAGSHSWRSATIGSTPGGSQRWDQACEDGHHNQEQRSSGYA